MSNNGSKSVNIDGLSKLYKQDADAIHFFDFLSGRTNNSRESTVDRLLSVLTESGSNLGRRDLVRLLHFLADHNAGEFILGRRGQKSRFRWTVGMIGLAKAVRGEPNALVEPIEQAHAVIESIDDNSSVEAVQPGAISHTYRLRPDLRITLALPANLTGKEASRLAEFIRTLPFDDQNVATDI